MKVLIYLTLLSFQPGQLLNYSCGLPKSLFICDNSKESRRTMRDMCHSYRTYRKKISSINGKSSLLYCTKSDICFGTNRTLGIPYMKNFSSNELRISLLLSGHLVNISIKHVKNYFVTRTLAVYSRLSVDKWLKKRVKLGSRLESLKRNLYYCFADSGHEFRNLKKILRLQESTLDCMQEQLRHDFFVCSIHCKASRFNDRNDIKYYEFITKNLLHFARNKFDSIWGRFAVIFCDGNYFIQHFEKASSPLKLALTRESVVDSISLDLDQLLNTIQSFTKKDTSVYHSKPWIFRYFYSTKLTSNEAYPVTFKEELYRQSKASSFIENCPRKCKCFFKDENEFMIGVNCEGKRLSVAPPIIPFETTYVNLRGNRIRSLSAIIDYWWKEVTHLVLRENRFKILHYVQLPSKLVTLDLAYNRLTDFPAAFMEQIDRNSSYKIYLNGNRWKCTCNEFAFVKWFKRNQEAIVDYEKVVCFWFEEVIATEARIAIKVRELTCGIHRLAAISAATTFFLLVIVPLIVICGLFYHFRQLMFAILYEHRLYPAWLDGSTFAADDGALYDIFICFHLKNREVANSIITTLGSKYVVSTQEHTWLPRPTAARDLLFRFFASRVTLLIASRRFVKSVWFQVEFRKIYYSEIKWRVSRMIIIEIKDCRQDPGIELLIRKLFPKEAILRWEDIWFWEKLRFALRHTTIHK